jgi:hypothetical protein
MRREGKRVIDTADAADVLQTGVDAGITYGFGYWGYVVQFPPNAPGNSRRKHETGWAAAFRQGEPVKIWEHEENEHISEGGKVFQVSAKRLLRGIRLVADEDGRAPWWIVDNCDGAMADRCLQFAIFGEERYS